MKIALLLSLFTFHIFAHPVIDQYLESKIVGKNLPSASLLISSESNQLYQFHSHRDNLHVDSQTLYDLASLTKVFTLLAVKIVLNGQDLNKPLDYYFKKEFKLSSHQRKVLSKHTVLDLVYHESMFRDLYGKYFEDNANQPTWMTIFDRIAETQIGHKRYKYKDIHFILLGKIVEIESGMKLADFFKSHIFEKIGLTNSHVFSLSPDNAKEIHRRSKNLTKANIIRLQELQKLLPDKSATVFSSMMPSYNMTAYNKKKNLFIKNGLIQIYNYQHLVHDPIARFMGGVAGHAGIISSLGDISKLVAVFLESRIVSTDVDGHGLISYKEGLNQELGIAHKDIFESFSLVRKSGRGQGLDIMSRYSASPRGGDWKNGKVVNSAFPKLSFGLTGYTGTSFIVDTCFGLNYILLTNRTHHNLSHNPSLNDARKGLARLIIKHYASETQDDCRYRKNESRFSPKGL